MQKSEIEKLMSADIDAAQKAALAMLDGADDGAAKAEAYYLLGRIAWKKGDKAGAITHYGEAVDADPHSEAAVALEQARDIMDFFNKDLYNP